MPGGRNGSKAVPQIYSTPFENSIRLVCFIALNQSPPFKSQKSRYMSNNRLINSVNFKTELPFLLKETSL